MRSLVAAALLAVATCGRGVGLAVDVACASLVREVRVTRGGPVEVVTCSWRRR